MTSKEFILWLKGFTEGVHEFNITPKQWDLLKDKLAEVKDESIGSIKKWKWDFGNGETSTEQNPIHAFKQKGVRTVITLEVEGPEGSSKRTRYWEVMIR